MGPYPTPIRIIAVVLLVIVSMVAMVSGGREGGGARRGGGSARGKWEPVGVGAPVGGGARRREANRSGHSHRTWNAEQWADWDRNVARMGSYKKPDDAGSIVDWNSYFRMTVYQISLAKMSMQGPWSIAPSIRG